jgi:membrane protein
VDSAPTDARRSTRRGRLLGGLTAFGRVIPVAIDRYFADRCPQHAAAIAFRALFSMAPLAIVLVAAFGVVLRDDELRADVIDAIVDALPVSGSGADQVRTAIDDIASPASFVGFAALIAFAWAASGMMGALRVGLETALRVGHTRPAARSKLVDLALVVGAGVLVVALVVASALTRLVLDGVDRALKGIGADVAPLSPVVNAAVPALIATLVVLLLYRFVPTRHLKLRHRLAGAAVTGVLLMLLGLLSGVIYEQTLRMSAVYGSLTTLFVFVYSVYLYASALLFGAEVANAGANPPPPSGKPLGVQVRDTVVGLFRRRDG